jgi:hypothetical protein
MANRFQLGPNVKAHVRLHKLELDGRIQTLSRNIKLHEHDPENDRDLNRLVNSWRRQLMELKLERRDLR